MKSFLNFFQLDKNIEGTFFVSAGAKNGVRNSRFWKYFTTISTESKK